MFPEGYKGPGSQYSFEHVAKKNMLKRLKNVMKKSVLAKLPAKKQKQENQDSKYVSSVEPTYPGFKGE